MAKRQKLDYNMKELTQHLKESSGRGVDALFSQPSPTPNKQEQENGEIRKTARKPLKKKVTNQSTDQLVDQSTGQLIGKVLDKPVAFYIPEIINKKIDEAVRYYQKKYGKKIDRSAVVSAFLGDPDSWTNEALDNLADKVIEQLTSRLVNRPVS
jgi:hypothetical protein